MNRYEELNRKEYGERYDRIRFLKPEDAERAEAERRSLIESIGGRVEWGAKGTKADYGRISGGCRICSEGGWSCLFINGKCNCKCFYCPSPQDENCMPTTNSISFVSPEEYIVYLKKYGFTGVSISGGEPLLTPKLTLSYIKAVRKAFPSMYIWMYTNGTLVTDEIVAGLKEAGLNELRFDIGADGYTTEHVRKACGVIDTVTVEIPAVPEETELMKSIMRELSGMGVKHLNLHQLRLTPYNFEKLIERDYTYLHGDKVAVLESELTALRLMKYSKDAELSIDVNYCSFVYKNRFQGAAARRRNSAIMLKEGETVTENGYIKTTDGDKTVYSFGVQLPSVSYRNPFETIKLSKKRSFVVERVKAPHPEDASVYESIEEGMQRYR
ncbi:MAG: radical SAM protein [Deferribacterales bacterium]